MRRSFWKLRHSVQVHRCRRATSEARTPAEDASSNASWTSEHAVSRATAVRRRFSRARARSERVVWTVVSSSDATSSCERPSEALSTSTERWRSGNRTMSPSRACASARRASSSGTAAAPEASASSSTSPTGRERARRSSSTQALRTSRESQARGSIGTTPARSAALRRAGRRPAGRRRDRAGAAQQPRGLAAEYGSVALEDERERLLVTRGEAGAEARVLRGCER